MTEIFASMSPALSLLITRAADWRDCALSTCVFLAAPPRRLLLGLPDAQHCAGLNHGYPQCADAGTRLQEDLANFRRNYARQATAQDLAFRETMIIFWVGRKFLYSNWPAMEKI